MGNKKNKINRMTACKMKFICRIACYTKWDQKRNEDILDELKMKPMIDYIQNYQRKWKEHMEQNEYRRNPRTNFMLPAKRTKINWISSKEMGGKYGTITGCLA
jgi:hypothetical protein